MNINPFVRGGVLVGLLWATTVAANERAAHPDESYASAWAFDLAGELRERFESVNNPVFGLPAPEQDNYLLHRAILSGQLEYRDDMLAHVELVSGLTSGFEGTPPPTQDDSLDVLQAYVEKSLSISSGQFVVRAGRQELSLGASRLVSVRASPNIRRAFDGIKTTWVRGEDESVNAFFLRPVATDSGAFDDRSSSQQRFWGIYATRPVRSIEGLGIDAYYLGLDRKDAHFAQGEARERRHTIGLRAFGERAGWDWNLEAAWQWGSFGDSNIRAWTVSVDAGYEFARAPMSPRLGLKVDAISGDRNPFDRQLGTFNPLFPRLPYFSEANLATPANLLDLQPNLRLSLSERLTASISWNGLWKQAKADAYYAPPLAPINGTALSKSRDIGWQRAPRLTGRRPGSSKSLRPM